MNYSELKSIAQPHLREGGDLPSNAFLLLTQLHITFRSKRQCEAEFGSKMTPLYNTPAYLEIDSDGNKVLYFNDSTKYWNFYIFHEIAHFILGHENDCPQNEMDADLLACILAAPLENLPSTLKSARDLSTICKIPIDKAEVYWEKIKGNFSIKEKKPLSVSVLAIIFTCIYSITILFFIGFSVFSPQKEAEASVVNFYQYQGEVPLNGEIKAIDGVIFNSDTTDTYFITAAGSKYHKDGCQYIKGKDNLIEISASELDGLGYEPCKVCIK